MNVLLCLAIIPIGWFILWLASRMAEKQKKEG